MIRRPQSHLVPLVLGGLVLAGCGAGGARTTGATSSSSGLQPTGAPAPAVAVRSTGLGPVLTTPAGGVIYELTSDRPGARSCSGSCLSFWPPVMINGTPRAAAGVTAQLGELPLNGGQQLTVDGHPAYTYLGDTSAGQTAGEAVRSFGGTWWALSTTGAAVTSTAPKQPPASGGAYGGY